MGRQLADVLWHVGDSDSTYTVINDAVYDSTSNIYYITDNIDTSGFIYAIDSNFKVVNLFDASAYADETFVEELLYMEGELYALIYGDTYIDTKHVMAFNLIKLDPDTFAVLEHSNWFRLFGDGDVHYLSKDSEYFYISSTSPDDMEARVYAIPVTNMVEAMPDEDTDIRNVSTVRYSATSTPSEGYHYVFSAYENGQMYTMENGNGIINDDVFDTFAEARFENKRLSPAQIAIINKTDLRFVLLVTIAGILFILALTFFVKHRNRVAYMIVLWEVMLALVLGFSVYGLYKWDKSTNWDEILKFASFTLDDVRADLDELEYQFENTDSYYRTEDYRNITDRLRKVVSDYANGEVFSNAISLAYIDGGYHVVAAARGLDNCDLEKLYGEEAVKLADFVRDIGIRNQAEVTVDGETLTLICVGKKGETNPTSLAMAVINENGSDEQILSEIYFVTIIAFVLFIIFSIAGIYILSRQARDLKLLGTTMMDVSQGGVGIKRPDTLGEDMTDMWSGLMDIDRSFKNLNYIKFRTFEAYYKFAPKSVERLLDKTSITEVVSGDMVKKTGTIVLLRTDMNNMLLGLSRLGTDLEKLASSAGMRGMFDLISGLQEENRAYKISATSDFSEVELVIPENANDACKIGVEISGSYRGTTGYGACVFMHYAEYIYGVSISGEEAVHYLISDELMRIRQNLSLLDELRLAMVVTGDVLNRELEKPSNRYIGYWESADRRVELYEILDACTDEIRKTREETRKLFDEGLELFYESNFYLARNNFAKVIKADYSDTVARWYLFTCEKYLDGSTKTVKFALSE